MNNTKTIICKDCNTEVVIKKLDGRTIRCKKCQDKFNHNYQNNYQKEYFQKYRRVKAQDDKRPRTYKRRYIDSLDDVEYCKQNWQTVEGCLNCKCKECLQPVDNDSFLPWEKEGFYRDDKKIENKLEYEFERNIK